MENPSKASAPMSALWIAASDEMRDRTAAITSKLFSAITFVHFSELSWLNMSRQTPGSPIILEFDNASTTQEWIEDSHRMIMQIRSSAIKSIVLCVGHQVPAEVVVDWVRMGVFSYVERTADQRHLQQAFQSLAQEAAMVQDQYHRYEQLRQLWNSISDREVSVLSMLMEGLPNKKIANSLGVSQRTIEARRQKLYEKLDSRSVVDVVRTIYELESLERIFLRIDSGYEVNAIPMRGVSHILRNLPTLHSGISKAHFENYDQMNSSFPPRKSE